MKNILFIGLGRMAYPIAGHVSKQEGYNTYIYNRSEDKATKWLDQHEGQLFCTNTIYDFIVICVGGDNDVRVLLKYNDSFTDQLNTNAIIIDHTTTSANLSKELSEYFTTKSIHYIDAPVSGGEAGAINGQLTCMVGGDEKAFIRSLDLLQIYCANTTYIGSSGSGQIAKMSNQLCIAGILSGLSEAITLIEKEGIDAKQVFKAIKGGAAQSWQMDNRFETMINQQYDFGFAIDHMIKDLNYALDQANTQNWTPPISTKVLSFYKALSEQKFSTQDTSVLVEYYRNVNTSDNP